MHLTIARAAGVLLTALLAAPLVATAQTAERSRTQGLKETGRFIKAGNNAHASIANARVETKHTLDMYNKLVTQPSKNMKGDYKKLMGAVDDMKEEIADARLEITGMRATGDTYFNGRSMDVYIAKLRKYLKDDTNIEIVNIHGNGFRLVVKEV